MAGRVWPHYRRWRDNGTLAAVHEALRRLLRQQAGAQLQERAVHRDETFVADREAPVLGEPRDRTLYDPAVTVEVRFRFDLFPIARPLPYTLTRAV